MGRPLRLLNLTLCLVAVLIAGALAKTWVSPADSIPVPASLPKPSQEAAPPALSPTPRPPLAQFDILLDKNPFKQPPPMPVRPAKFAPPPPPPAPLPTLLGTILVDEARRAVLGDKGKSNIYSIGEEVAGGVIAEIKEDRIAFKRGDDVTEIFLKAAIETVPSSAGQAVVSSPMPQMPALPASVGPSPSALQKEMVKQEKMVEKQQKKLLRQQFKSR